jgi:hypothetical protein
MKKLSPIAIGILLAFATITKAAGPKSPYYLTAGFEGVGRIFAIQGTNVIFNVSQIASPIYSESPIAVNATIRTAAYYNGGFPYRGGEYALDGTPTGTNYPTINGLNGLFFDGTTDGTNNYAWEANSGAAYRFDLTWTNPVVLFTLGVGDGHREGITYDPSNNSLWIAGSSGAVGRTVENRTLSGALISSFHISSDLSTALAIDPADGTLWLNYSSGPRQTLDFEQFSRDGISLSTLSISSLIVPGTSSAYTVHGGEFAFTGTVFHETNLAIARSGTNVIVSWPTPSLGYLLQENTNIINTNGWTNYGGTVSSNSTTLSVTLTPAAAQKFYRLKK